MRKRNIALALAAFLLLSTALTGCGQKKKRDFIVPPFEKFTPNMSAQEVAEIIGVEVAETSYTSRGDSIFGYAYRRDEYKILQSDGVIMDFECVINTEQQILDHAVFSIESAYYGEDGLTDEEMQLLQKHAEFIVNYFIERLGEPEVEVEGELTTHTWYMENGAKIRLKNGVQYTMYDLDLWWQYFG